MADKRNWSKKDTFKLIAEFQSRPELWDLKCKEYKNKLKKQCAISVLAHIFEATENEVTRKIHNLRTQFHQELRKAQKKHGGDESYHSSWEFFDAMSFIHLDHSHPKISNYALETKTEYIEENEPCLYESLQNLPVQATETRKNKNEERDDMTQSRAMKFMEKSTDEFQIFGDFVASELRNLRSRKIRNNLKRTIQRAILEASELDDSVCSSESSSEEPHWKQESSTGSSTLQQYYSKSATNLNDQDIIKKKQRNL